MTHNIFRARIITISFLVIISLPFINSKTKWVKDIASTENRQMASKPLFDIKHLDPYPSKFEKYYNDNFSIRSFLVKYYNFINLEVFKKTLIPDQIIIGNDGWLFSASNENDSYRGKHRLNPSELNALKLELEYRKKYLNQKGCKFYVLIAPVKANIYSDKIKYNTLRDCKQSWGEQLIEYLDSTSQVKPINVYNILRMNKKNQLYYKLDNHWNEMGTFYAVYEALKCMHIDFPEISPTELNEYNIQKTEINTGNLISMFSNIGQFKDSMFQLTPKSGFKATNTSKVGYPVVKGFPYPWEYEEDKELKNKNKSTILIISDSFGKSAFPFFAEHFNRSVKIFDGWQYKLNEDIVAAEKPNIMVLIILESNIRSILNFQSRLKK